ncbi:MOSC domain-containing protein (plasmid) [Ensifer adhaerens]|uniref:MOSC domain-containing protein n=1 Tax=Ensifer adhaerens TaxID=106592 RepID=UPI001CBE3448|nr:MOSC domain-containing protein [Ensifer adhaerens]MBZ7927265.1 MOSC domain-containing protein [Ensifer adhaerens]UAX98282.1 MOSC domain-containing protein [Ensifer adhaerens]UAY05664.1 MOSC domain-containing protein [Ensifer adhaerens]UAY13042.1 MOSC domain-containing protein [Ensifer adhaerens]
MSDGAQDLRVLAVCLGQAETRPGKKTKTGINKHPTNKSVFVGFEGLDGDAVCNRKFHGGPEQAVYIEGDVSRLWWQKTLKIPIDHGQFGENLCIEGLDNQIVTVGDRFTAGDLVMEVTAPRMPCRVLFDKMGDAGFPRLYRNAARPGFYCRIIQPGLITAGTLARYVPYGGERISMPEMMSHHGQRVSPELIARYQRVPVHAKLRASLSKSVIRF